MKKFRNSLRAVLLVGALAGLLAFPPIAPAGAAAGDITTVAGSGLTVAGACGPTSTPIRRPRSVAVDTAGNVYLTDTEQFRVLKVNVDGAISVLAGDGTAGNQGDDGPALAARFQVVFGIAVDGQGNIYIADAGNHRVRKISTGTGIITAAAGTGAFGFQGDGGPATAARLNQPNGLAVDGAGNLYIADSGNHRIRRVDTTGTITTVAGGGTDTPPYIDDDDDVDPPATDAVLSSPRDVSLDGAGNIYIADTVHYQVQKVTAATGTIATVAGTGARDYFGDGGEALKARFREIFSVDVTASGELLVADTETGRIRKAVVGGNVDSVAGGGGSEEGPALNVNLNFPTDVAVHRPSGTYYVADRDNDRIVRVTPDGTLSLFVGAGGAASSGDGCLATLAPINHPTDAADMADGSFLIADRDNNRVRRVTPAGIITTFAGTGTPTSVGEGGPATKAGLAHPTGVTVGPDGSVYIADREHGWVRRVSPAGTLTTVAGALNKDQGFSGDGGPATAAQLRTPTSIAFDGAGNLYIADETNHRIRKVTAATGIITTVAGTSPPIFDPVGAFGGDGGPATAARLSSPTDVAVDAAGNLFIADAGNSRIRKVDPGGTITTFAGVGFGFSGDNGPAKDAALAFPYGLAFGGTDLFVSDTGNQRVRRIDAFGTITTVGGDGNFGFTGDGKPATATSLADPYGLVVDAGGNILLADGRNNRIRRIEKPPPPTTTTTTAVTTTTEPGVTTTTEPEGTAPLDQRRADAAYWLAGRDGGVFAFGAARFVGSAAGVRLTAPVVAMAGTPSGAGYWLVSSDGGVFAFGDARYRGSLARLRLNQPVVAIAATPSGNGYWLVAADGGVFAFGDARYLGSTGALRLERPIEGMAPTLTGDGYWLVAADGGVFAFGDAAYRGSLGHLPLSAPVRAFAASPSGKGYWLVASDGGVFAFGDARYRGSLGRLRLNAPVLGIVVSTTGNGYLLMASDGGVFAFGDAGYRGSAAALPLSQPIAAAAGPGPG